MDLNIVAAAVTALTNTQTTSNIVDLLLSKKLEQEDEGIRYRYISSIPYTQVSDTHILDMNTVLVYYLMRFIFDETKTFLLFLRLDKLRFRNRFAAISEQAIEVILIRLFFLTRY